MDTKKLRAEIVVTNVLERIQAENRAWQADGKDAWSALRSLGGGNLPRGDEVVIARNLHSEYPTLKKALKSQATSVGKFCTDCGLGTDGGYTKELHRMMLPPATSPEKVHLRRNASKYRNLLKGISRVYGVSVSSLANRLMVGMSLHPANAVVRDKVERVQAMLQGIVDGIDDEFGMFALFKETAELKAKHAESGGSCRWPHMEADEREWVYMPGNWLAAKGLNEMFPNGYSNPFSDTEKNALASTAKNAERAAAMDTSRAYWQEPVTNNLDPITIWRGGPALCGCVMSDDFFYVPHVYLGYGGGVLDAADDETTSQAPSELCGRALEIFKRYGSAPCESWDAVAQKPIGPLSSMEDYLAHYHAWLIIYPSPDNTKLMPMLLVPIEECGPILIPLDSIALSWLRNAFWVGPEGQTKTFFDRIKSLIGAKPSEAKTILEGLKLTAPWFRSNPFMKMKEEDERDSEYARALCLSMTVK